MQTLLIRLVNMSITAGWLILAILLLRLLLTRAPKALRCLLWALVGLRLVFPFSVQSVLSLIPSAQTVTADILYARVPAIDSGIALLNGAVNPILSQSMAPEPAASVNPMQVVWFIASVLWIAGMIVLAAYSVISYSRLRRRVATAVRLRENIWQTEAVSSPFVLGFFRPRIYLPFTLTGENRAAVIAHEQAHIRRRDHWIKPIGFLLLTVYWFNPLIWLAYILLCRDIELACDERVIRQLDTRERRSYSEALLSCTAGRRTLAACPLAFGEVGVKKRIRNVLSYKKPAFWVVLTAVVASVTVAACFLTNPKINLNGKDYDNSILTVTGGGSEYEGVEMSVRAWEGHVVPTILTVTWHNNSGDDITFGDVYRVEKWEADRWVDCAYDENTAFSAIGYPLPSGEERIKNYYNYAYDLTRVGAYRLTADFYLDKDIPVTPDETHEVWIEFTLTEGQSPDNFQGVYAFDECLYMSPLSSFYPAEGTGLLYALAEDGFIILNEQTGEVLEAVSPMDWMGQGFTDEQWNSLFMLSDSLGGPAPAGPDSRMMYAISDRYRIYIMDGIPWLVEMRADQAWSVYRLRQTDAPMPDIGRQSDFNPASEHEVIIQSGDNRCTAIPAAQGYETHVEYIPIDPAHFGQTMVPFSVFADGAEIKGARYSVRDASTGEELDVIIPSGLSSQTYLLRNTQAGHRYIVTLTFTDGSGQKSYTYAFGIIRD